MYEPAGKVRVIGGGFAAGLADPGLGEPSRYHSHLAVHGAASSPSLALRRSRLARLARAAGAVVLSSWAAVDFLRGRVTVNDEVAREISTPCCCSISQQIRLRARPRIVARKYVRRGSFGLRLQDRALAFQIEILEEQFAVVGEVME